MPLCSGSCVQKRKAAGDIAAAIPEGTHPHLVSGGQTAVRLRRGGGPHAVAGTVVATSKLHTAAALPSMESTISKELVVEEYVKGVSKSACTYEEFSWGHGCRTVHVCGSFTTNAWKERVQLLRDESSPGTLFRRTILLPPGEHQFKFVVLNANGREEWLLDDKLPKVNDGRGNWNNLVSVPEKGLWDRLTAFLFPPTPPAPPRPRDLPSLPAPGAGLPPARPSPPPPEQEAPLPGALGAARGKRDGRVRFRRSPGKASPLGARVRRTGEGAVSANFAVHTDGRVTALSVLLWVEQEPDVSDDPLYDGSPFLLLPLDSPLAPASPRNAPGWLSHSVASLLAGLAGGDPSVPDHVLELDRRANRTAEQGGEGFVWHVEVADLPLSDGECLLYALLPSTSPVPVIDPYARLLDTPSFTGWGRGLGELVRCVPEPVEAHFDWQGVAPPNIPFSDLVIYEMHVAGFTAHPSSGTRAPRGTFRAMIERIPHLVELGVNCVELMPVFEWDEREHVKRHPATQRPLHNYWGYSHVSFMAGMGRFAGRRLAALREAKTLVRELHRAGIEVILDVVYNHTGGTAFEALARDHYYILSGAQHHHTNYTGCGNTVNASHPATLELILESLRFWAEEVQVDGFRFDLAPVLARGADGKHQHQPVFWRRVHEMFTQRPQLRGKKLIVETWELDSSRMGCFWFGGAIHEWNGRFKESVRAFVRGAASNEDFATRLAGSADYYQGKHKGVPAEARDAPEFSINFVTCHDGFTMRDLVSYAVKHNEGNGEANRDGANDNQSWNCGVEGPSKDPAVGALRGRQMKNFAVALLVARGVPMLLSGDEYGHSKGGNNNTWNQDNELNWFDWGALAEQRGSECDLFRFWSRMIALRRGHPALRRNAFFGGPGFAWHAADGSHSPFGGESRFLAFSLHEPETRAALYVAFNSSAAPAPAAPPPRLSTAAGQPAALGPWRRLADTALRSPDDFAADEAHAPPLPAGPYAMAPHSAIILVAFEEGAAPGAAGGAALPHAHSAKEAASPRLNGGEPHRSPPPRQFSAF
eukprot:tig00020703_g13138.t1